MTNPIAGILFRLVLAEKLSPELAKEYGNNHILRVVTKHLGDDMYYATTCPEGTALWLTVRDEEVIFNEMERIVQNIDSRNNHKKPIAVFHADCLARGRFLTDRIFERRIGAQNANSVLQRR